MFGLKITFSDSKSHFWEGYNNNNNNNNARSGGRGPWETHIFLLCFLGCSGAGEKETQTQVLWEKLYLGMLWDMVKKWSQDCPKMVAKWSNNALNMISKSM